MKIFDSNQVQISICGIPIDPAGGGAGGYAEDEFLTIDYDNDAFTDMVGADGEVTRSKTNDKRATITLKLMSSSAGNAALSSLHNLDRNTPNGAGVGALSIVDLGGLSLFAATECWIAKAPAASYGKGPTVREWKIRCASLEAFHGGN